MLVVGLTGGFGSGKSTVANLFYQCGIHVINADSVARKLTELHQPAYQKIVSYFGESFTKENQALNRAMLRQHIFNHLKDKKWLEKLPPGKRTSWPHAEKEEEEFLCNCFNSLDPVVKPPVVIAYHFLFF